ncbi:copper amine oxidase N-terminal domain-containing protein [Aneurinibacillus tyrosinisolvens]|uniref:copper amine oxidase N-terminal domain-containing protein n=1 Tax=Aneurinibacillus tyrosinisolvens TaxID=1443435 RepID=UPI00069A3E50|nr:copper amine oxidase N-terminal domain-containing protein [Aneurinibacillus tyrosinisolvens]
MSSTKKLGELYKKAGEKGIKVFTNGEEVNSEEAPFSHGGRAMVPLRAISASLKADVQWDAGTKSITITKGEQTIVLHLDKSEANVNGQTVTLDSSPIVKNGRSFLPLRFISEQLKAKVDWEQEGEIVVISDPTAGEPAPVQDSTTAGEAVSEQNNAAPEEPASNAAISN